MLHAFWVVLNYDLLNDRRVDDVIIGNFSLGYIKQIDSMLPCVCSVIDQRRRENVVRTSVTHSPVARVPLFLFLPYFDVIYVTKHTYGNMETILNINPLKLKYYDHFYLLRVQLVEAQ